MQMPPVVAMKLVPVAARVPRRIAAADGRKHTDNLQAAERPHGNGQNAVDAYLRLPAAGQGAGQDGSYALSSGPTASRSPLPSSARKERKSSAAEKFL